MNDLYLEGFVMAGRRQQMTDKRVHDGGLNDGSGIATKIRLAESQIQQFFHVGCQDSLLGAAQQPHPYNSTST